MFDLVTWYWREVYWDLAGPFRGPFTDGALSEDTVARAFFVLFPGASPQRDSSAFHLRKTPVL